MSSPQDLGALLTDMCAIPAVSGREQAMAKWLRDQLQAVCDHIEVDVLGNVLCRLTPSHPPSNDPAPKIMIAAHLDEIGLLVQWIEKSGALRVAPVGGVDVKNALGQRVTVHGKEPLPGLIGTVPPHLTKAADRDVIPEWSDLFIDIGLAADEVKKLVKPGDPITFDSPLTTLAGDKVAGKALDNRAGLAAAVISLQSLAGKSRQAEIILAATAQEEVGMRGAAAAAHHLSPDAAIAIDVGFAQMPGIPPRRTIEMGAGPAVAVGPNMHPGMGAALQDTARHRDLPHQIEVLPGNSGTDAWAIQVAGDGVPTALLSIPLRYMHSTVEVASLNDIRATASLIEAFCLDVTAEHIRGWHSDPFTPVSQ